MRHIHCICQNYGQVQERAGGANDLTRGASRMQDAEQAGKVACMAAQERQDTDG
jgi:hypothetical protein